MIQRLLALQRSRSRLEDLEAATNELVRRVDEEAKAARAGLRPILTRLEALAKDPTDSGKSLTESQREFRNLLERRKLLVAVVLPLREEAALARRYASDLKGWNEVIDRESWQALQGLALDLLGVIVALAVILIGGVLWRVATIRYVSDGARRRLLLTTRSVVVTLAVALVLIFHFTSEMAALVTALGFAAAGIAFALQNVILAVAGYFTMVAPNGIRVGDRVSLQGPFGYVHGEVAERLEPREPPHVSDDLGDLPGRVHDLGEPPLLLRREIPAQELEPADDDGQRIVDLVRGRVGELSDRAQGLGAALGFFGAAVVGDVLDRAFPVLVLAVAQRASIHPGPDGAAVVRPELHVKIAGDSGSVPRAMGTFAVFGVDVQQCGVDAEQGFAALEPQH